MLFREIVFIWRHPVSRIDVALGTVTPAGKLELIDSTSFEVTVGDRDGPEFGSFISSPAATLFETWMKSRQTQETVIVSADPGAYLGPLNCFMNTHLKHKNWQDIADVVDVSERGVWWRSDSCTIETEVEDARRGLELYARAVSRSRIFSHSILSP